MRWISPLDEREIRKHKEEDQEEVGAIRSLRFGKTLYRT